jgi:hypothetical protein
MGVDNVEVCRHRPRPDRRRRPARLDLGERWLGWLVATAAEHRLTLGLEISPSLLARADEVLIE